MPSSITDYQKEHEQIDASTGNVDSAGVSKHCPLCDEALMSNWSGPLYGTTVCESCRRSFVRRRHWAYIIYVLTMSIAGIIIAGLLDWMTLPAVYAKVIAIVALLWFLLRDSIPGLELGRRLFDLEVVDNQTRRRADPLRAAIRNFLTLLYGIIAPHVAWQIRRGPRFDDRWTGTRVIRKRLRNRLPFRGDHDVCLACGYDLTGRTSNRCPECGTYLESDLHTSHSVQA